MAWFNSIVQGIGSAVNWAMSNAGNIEGLINSIRKVSALKASGADAGNDLPVTSKHYFEVFEEANDLLKEKAKNKAELVEKKTRWDDPKQPFDTITGELSGLWTSPTVFSNLNKEVPEMYRDLVKLFAELRVPTLMKMDGEYVDVAELVSQSIFASNPDPPSEIANFDADNDLHLPAYGIPLRDDESPWQLFVAHAYYTIPMGRTGADVSWHGAIYVKMKARKKALQLHAQEMEEFRFIQDIGPLVVNSWLVTFQIAWKAVKVARTGYKFLQRVLDEKEKDKKTPQNQKYEVKYNFLDGQVHTVKIKAPAKKAPSETLFYLQEAVAEAVVRMNTRPQDFYFDDGATATRYQTPYVALTDSTLLTPDNTLISNTGTGDTMVIVSH